MGDTFRVCEPCRDNHHLECDATEKNPCDCLVCTGERIGDQVMGDAGGNVPKRRQL